MSKEVIYIDVKDDVTSIIDKINKTEQKIVALVPPKQIGVLQSAVNLQLLAHTAKQTKKIMVIITNQEALIRLASVAKIPVAKSLTSKPSMPEIPALKVDGDDDIIDGAQLSVGELADMSKKSSAISSDVAEVTSPTNKLSPAKIKVPNYDKFRKKLFIGGVTLLMFSGFLIWAVIFAPRAEITILTNTKGVNVAPSVSLVDQADQAKFENNSLYAQTQKSTHKRSVEFMATGEKELKTHATGEMTVLRRSGSSPKLLPAGTIFTSNSGLRFKSIADVTVPGATYDENNNPTPGRAKVRVQALEVGDKYNIPAQAYSVQTSSNSITATGGAMSGGSQRIIKVITQQDYDKALKGDGRFPGFTRLANDYSSTDAGNLANVYAGISYEKTGKIKEAIKYLEQFSPKSDHTISPAGIAALANCYASDKQVDKAVEAFKKAADKAANPALSPLYLLEAGKLLESQKKNDQALEVYQLIKKSYPTSTMATPQRLQNGTFANPEIDRYIERVSK